MKRISILLIALVISCSLLADTDFYVITWDEPTETGLVLNLYIWSGADSMTCPFFTNYPLDPSSEYFSKQIGAYQPMGVVSGPADGIQYISVMGQYQRVSNSLLSGTTWATVEGTNNSSHFRLSNDKTIPPDVENLKIEKNED